MVRGRHTFKTGLDIRRIQLNNSGNTLTTSSISYASTDDFINNKASSATYLQGEGVVGNRRTGGAHAYPITRSPDDPFQSLEVNYHYLTVEVRGDRLKVTTNRVEMKEGLASWTQPDSLAIPAAASQAHHNIFERLSH